MSVYIHNIIYGMILDPISLNINSTVGDAVKIMKDFNRDYWMDAAESVEYGIVDGILE